MTAIEKTELNKRLRESRKEAGLVEVRIWVPREAKEYMVAQFERIINRYTRGES